MVNLRRTLATKVVDPLAWSVKGTPVGARLREFRKQQWDDRETFERRRNERLADLLVHAVARVPFYRERVSGVSPEQIRSDPLGSLARFPILEKHDVRDNPDHLTCETGHRLVEQHTGGTTSMPLKFYRDTHSLGASLATTQLALEWTGAERGGRRVRLWPLAAGAPRPSLLQRLVNRVHGRVVLSSFLMTDETIREYLRILNARPIDILDGPPTAFVEIASFAERNGLELPRPRAIVSGGSSLYGHLRERIAEAYGAPVFNHYGC
jgi:phenylacetate-CoA ligase